MTIKIGDKLLYTVREAVEITRFSESWWRQKIMKKEIEHVKHVRKVLIPAHVIKDMIEQATVPVASGE